MIAFAGLVGSILSAGVTDDVVLILASQFLWTGGILWVLGKVRRREFRRLAFEVEIRDGLLVFLGVGLQILLAFLFLPLAMLVGLETEPQSLAQEITGTSSTYQGLALLLLVGLIGPVLEELLFRGILIDALAARFKTKGVIVGSSAAFAAFHVVGVSTAQPLESIAVLIPQLFLFGAVLAYLRLKRERLGPPIFTHAGFNLLSLSVLLFFPEML